MIQIKNGDILTSKANIICHQVNCMGVMGAGLARAIREKYPVVYERYKALCDKHKPSGDLPNLLGKFQDVKISDNQSIYNLFAQFKYGRDAVHTDYQALTQCFKDVRSCAELTGATVAIPYRIGCGLAGGDWATAKQIIYEIFDDSPICVEIWRYHNT